MLDPHRRLRSHRDLQLEALRRASTYAHFSQNQPLYLNRAVGSRLNPYQWAVADYFGKPTVGQIDIAGWSGEIGQTICVQATDNLVVLRLHVKIWEGSFICEEGDAKQSDNDRSVWLYTTRSRLEPRPGVWLDVVAYDLPGNTGENFLVLK